MADRQTTQLRTKMLGAVLRQARLSAGRTLKETAEMIGVSSAVFSSYERGRRGISLPELELVGYQLRVSLSQLLHPSRGESKKKADFNPAVMVSLRQHYIGAMIRSHRNEAELSARDLARRCGVPAGRLTLYEQGERPIPVAELEAIADALGHDLSDYLDSRGPIGSGKPTRSLSRASCDCLPICGTSSGRPRANPIYGWRSR
jgi:transcriptional regulator with XRE-family HTH domain